MKAQFNNDFHDSLALSIRFVYRLVHLTCTVIMIYVH